MVKSSEPEYVVHPCDKTNESKEKRLVGEHTNKNTTAKGVREYNPKNTDAETLCDSPAAPIGSLGLGKLSSVPDMTHVEG